MGATLENSIIMCLVITVICALILLPLELCSDAYKTFGFEREEIEFHDEDDDIITSRTIGGSDSVDTSPERLCTFLSGLSENYRLIYDTIAGG